ncbi:AAA family ATPase [Actinosynnema sp. ALI-1.44]|uniref:AAA family ATPase n=1 Tax=Actinosynnema sp. ALI-1.44 TaxID=1933779 RepID=UPI001EDC2B8E|nr:ATP-binding protein [Actinosynnema sp. ALI-1.44]
MYDKDRLALNVAAIYGANAAGKSNLLDAVWFMREAVLRSHSHWGPDAGVPRRPFSLDPTVAARESIFVAEFVIDSVRYTYGFTVDNEVVREEWLYTYPEKRRRVMFERELNHVRFGSTVADRRKNELLARMMRPNSLFLSVAAASNVDTAVPIYRWFSRDLILHNWHGFFGRQVGAGRAFVNHEEVGKLFVEGSTAVRSALIDLVRAADLGITDVVVEANKDKYTLSKLTVKLIHDDGVALDPEDESAGTRGWLGLLPELISCLSSGGVLVIDEIDASFHPLLTARLIALFRDTETNPRGAQLLFSTHDASLLSPVLGEEVLRREEVWFVQKGTDGATELYPLSDFRPRKGENTERRYLGGSYGAAPSLFAERFADAVRAGLLDESA